MTQSTRRAITSQTSTNTYLPLSAKTYWLLFFAAAVMGCGTAETTPKPQASTAVSSDAAVATNAITGDATADVGMAAPSPPNEVSESKGVPSSKAATSASEVAAPPAATDSPVAEVTPQVKLPHAIAPTPAQLAKWTVPTYQPMQLLDCYEGFDDVFIQSMTIAPDGSKFAIGGAKLTIWKMGDAKPTIELTDSIKGSFEPPMRDVAISPDGKWLSAGDQKGMVWIWELDNVKNVVAISAYKSYVSALAFSSDSTQLATTSYSGEVSFWNVADGAFIKKSNVSDEKIVEMIYLAQDRLAVTGGEAVIWNVAKDQQEVLLAPRYVTATGFTLSHDHHRLFFCNDESVAHSRDIETASDDVTLPLSSHGAMHASYSDDGKWLAVNADASIRIIDVATGRLQQVIDANAKATAGIGWVPKTNLLLIASERDRVRLWGRPEDAAPLGIKPIQFPEVSTIQVDSRVPASAEQLSRVLDLRTMPKLPDAIATMGRATMDSYTTASTKAEVETFYRHVLAQNGWTELPSPNPQYTINFTKQGCPLDVSCYENSAPGEGGLSVNLSTPGNYDSRWLPKLPSMEAGNSYGFFTSSSYRVKDSLSAIEVALIKLFHANGWTGYSRLTAATAEQPDMRLIWMMQGGLELSITIGRPADQPDTWSIQTSVSTIENSLPIPPDSGWIEFDSSSEVMMVANTKMTLPQSIEFYDKAMAAEGWLARDAGRVLQEKEARAWSPYIRGQRDATIGMQSLPDGSTQIIVGNPTKLSWQLKKPAKVDTESAATGIEVADWPLPKGATEVEYKVDDKQLRFNLPGIKPLELIEKYTKQLVGLGWERDKSGVSSDEYVLATFNKGAAELELRLRLNNEKDSGVSVDGSGLLWNKPLPSKPQAISFATWLMRHSYPSSLDRLDEYAAEMKAIEQN